MEEEKETKEEQVNVKPEKGKQSIGKIIFNIIFWAAFAVVLFTWVVDYLNVRNNKEPNFCISKKTHTYDDGVVEECVGLGYKVYDYKRTSMTNGIEFVPFFVSMRESSE